MDQRPVWRYAHLPDQSVVRQQQPAQVDRQHLLVAHSRISRTCELALHAHARFLHPAHGIQDEVVLCRAGRYRVCILNLFHHHHRRRSHLETACPRLCAAHHCGHRVVLPWQVSGRCCRHRALRLAATHVEPPANELLLWLCNRGAHHRLPVQSPQREENQAMAHCHRRCGSCWWSGTRCQCTQPLFEHQICQGDHAWRTLRTHAQRQGQKGTGCQRRARQGIYHPLELRHRRDIHPARAQCERWCLDEAWQERERPLANREQRSHPRQDAGLQQTLLGG